MDVKTKLNRRKIKTRRIVAGSGDATCSRANLDAAPAIRHSALRASSIKRTKIGLASRRYQT